MTHCMLAAVSLLIGCGALRMSSGISSNHGVSPGIDLEEKYLHLVEMAVTGSLIDEAGRCNGGEGGCALNKLAPYDKSLRELGNDWPPFGHTMVGHVRLHNIRFALQDVIDHNVSGDFAELGVWRGGTCIYAKALFDIKGQASRRVHVFDAFEKIPGYGGNSDFLMNSEADVKHNFDKYQVFDDHVHFYKGLFKDTVPSFQGQLAVLRIDSNFYDSYQDALYYLYPKVPVGGIVIFDDVMSHAAVMQCWKDFKNDQGLPEDLTRIDHHSAWFRKTVAIDVDFKHFKPPRDANKL